MRKKINSRFIGIAIFSVLITMLLMTFVFYAQLKKQVFSDLEIVVNLLIDEEIYEKETTDLRITLIEADGTVAFDSSMDVHSMENHLDRPEVKEAIEKGYGKGQRLSNTLSKNVFYYAKLLDNGQVLRVAKEAHSVFAVLVSTIPLIVIATLLLTIVCLILSRYLTTAIISPIEEMASDVDHIKEESSYPELIPFARKINSQHEEILSAANMRQEFTANVTHELKTPLAAISGYAELMEAGMVNDKDIKHFSGEIRKSAARLLTLINDIIELSQLDSGYAKESLEIVNLAEIAQESISMLSIGATKNQIEIQYEGEKSAEVRIGKELAQELVFNLIENAIRYNVQGGKVFVSVLKKESRVSLVVEDTGIGIPIEHQSRIFERFYRVDKSRSKELGGTGLGLAIVKHICTLTDGEIKLESEPGKGTKITITWA